MTVTLEIEDSDNIDAVVLAYRSDGQLHTLAERELPATGTVSGGIDDA